MRATQVCCLAKTSPKKEAPDKKSEWKDRVLYIYGLIRYSKPTIRTLIRYYPGRWRGFFASPASRDQKRFSIINDGTARVNCGSVLIVAVACDTTGNFLIKVNVISPKCIVLIPNCTTVSIFFSLLNALRVSRLHSITIISFTSLQNDTMLCSRKTSRELNKNIYTRILA